MTREGDIDCYRHPISQSATGKRAVFHIDDKFAVSLPICSVGFIETLELVPPNDLDGTHMLPTEPTFLLYTSSFPQHPTYSSELGKLQIMFRDKVPSECQ